MNEVPALDFFLNLTFQRSNVDRFEDVSLLQLIINRQKRPHCDHSRITARLSIVHRPNAISFHTLSLVDCVCKLDVNITDLGWWVQVTVGVLFEELVILWKVLVVSGNLSKGPCRPIVVRVDWDGCLYGRNLFRDFCVIIHWIVDAFL